MPFYTPSNQKKTGAGGVKRARRDSTSSTQEQQTDQIVIEQEESEPFSPLRTSLAGSKSKTFMNSCELVDDFVEPNSKDIPPEARSPSPQPDRPRTPIHNANTTEKPSGTSSNATKHNWSTSTLPLLPCTFPGSRRYKLSREQGPGWTETMINPNMFVEVPERAEREVPTWALELTQEKEKELAEKLPKWHSHVTSQLFLTPEQKASQKNPDGTYKKGRWIPKIDDVFVHLEWEDTKFEKK